MLEKFLERRSLTKNRNHTSLREKIRDLKLFLPHGMFRSDEREENCRDHGRNTWIGAGNGRRICAPGTYGCGLRAVRKRNRATRGEIVQATRFCAGGCGSG